MYLQKDSYAIVRSKLESKNIKQSKSCYFIFVNAKANACQFKRKKKL